MELILLIILFVLLLGAWPTWPYSRAWGYNPFGIIALVLLVYFLLILTGAIVLVHTPPVVVPAP